MSRYSFLSWAGVLLLISFAGPSSAHAQRGARSSASVGVRRSSTMSGSVGRTSRRSSYSTGNGFYSNSLGNLNFFPPNGLGINGINTVATQNIGIEAAINPATQWELAIAQRVARNSGGVFSGGFYLLDGGGAYALPPQPADYDQPPPQQQPQVIVVQQAPPQQQAVVEQQAIPETPVKDVGQFTLILRNGTRIEAVAFTQMKDRIVYVTTDGSRRSIALADLDADATVRLNQERGTPLQLPL